MLFVAVVGCEYYFGCRWGRPYYRLAGQIPLFIRTEVKGLLSTLQNYNKTVRTLQEYLPEAFLRQVIVELGSGYQDAIVTIEHAIPWRDFHKIGRRRFVVHMGCDLSSDALIEAVVDTAYRIWLQDGLDYTRNNIALSNIKIAIASECGRIKCDLPETL